MRAERPANLRSLPGALNFQTSRLRKCRHASICAPRQHRLPRTGGRRGGSLRAGPAPIDRCAHRWRATRTCPARSKMARTPAARGCSAAADGVVAIAVLLSTCAETDSGRRESPVAKVPFGAPVERPLREVPRRAGECERVRRVRSVAALVAFSGSGGLDQRRGAPLASGSDLVVRGRSAYMRVRAAMRVLDIGGTGTFLARVRRRALKPGHDVRVCARRPSP
jgi:hypothetical protein